MHEYRIGRIMRTLFWFGAQLKRIKLKENLEKTRECSFITKVFCATNVIPPLNAITDCIRLYNSSFLRIRKIPPLLHAITSSLLYFSFFFTLLIRITIIKKIIASKDRSAVLACHGISYLRIQWRMKGSLKLGYYES